MAQLDTTALRYLHRFVSVFVAEWKGFLFEKVFLKGTEEDQLQIWSSKVITCIIYSIIW